MNTTETTVTLRHSDKTDTILLGYAAGSANLPGGRTLQVVTTGRTVRFTVDDMDGYVDLDLGSVAYAAARLLGAV